MFKVKYSLEVQGGKDSKGNQRIHSYFCEPGSPFGEIIDVLSTMRSIAVEEQKKSIEKEERKEAFEEECKEECTEECEKKEEKDNG